MRKYFGWEFKPALTTAIHKMASDCEIRRVDVTFKESIPTAAINRHGQILITNIKDDAVMSQLDLQKFTGFGLHELLHRKWTDFDQIDTSKSPYLLGLHNAIEDAFIENRAVRQALTGNVQGLLGLLIDTMATQALTEVADWADPKQYPFALAVYARKHGQVRVPLAKGLRPIFDEACSRLESASGTADTWKIAEWVYKQLMTQPEPPTTEPPVDKRKVTHRMRLTRALARSSHLANPAVRTSSPARLSLMWICPQRHAVAVVPLSQTFARTATT